jgi:AraC-like DNA-binding protein/quercetin dioxygenase-like cupin family protein
MTVSAPAANDLPSAANVEMVDLRAQSSMTAGTYLYEGPDLVTHWHCHNLHEVEYAFEGVVEIESAGGHYLLPPQQAAWIPAGLAHRTTLKRVRSVAVFFDPPMVEGANDRVRILAVAPVLREMYVYGLRWPIGRTDRDSTSDSFFEALAHLTRDALDHEAPLHLPTSTHPLVQAVMEYTRDNLATVTLSTVCANVGVSERTLRRQFGADTQMPWSQYVLTARLLRAMALLTEPRRTVLTTATDVGFVSLSAFSRAFAKFVGETPTAYRKRVLASR